MLYTDLKNDYYWTTDWSEEFYIELAKSGFISTTYDTKEGLVLLPELQLDYAILDFENLHVSKKVKRLQNINDATLHFNTRFDEVIDRISKQHQYNWFKDEYTQLINSLYSNKNSFNNFEICSVALISNENNELISGEIGYIIGKTYTSLTGFSSKEKKYNNYGTLQLVLLSQYLQNKGFKFWNLGHPHMQYKKKLGALAYTRKDFLARWEDAI